MQTCPKCGQRDLRSNGVIENPFGDHHSVQQYECPNCGWQNVST